MVTDSDDPVRIGSGSEEAAEFRRTARFPICRRSSNASRTWSHIICTAIRRRVAFFPASRFRSTRAVRIPRPCSQPGNSRIETGRRIMRPGYEIMEGERDLKHYTEGGAKKK